jgi:cytidylate kinase
VNTTAGPAASGFHGIIAVDGPSGSGKSSVCRAVARRLGAQYLDTGSMYRAVTWAALARGLDLHDQPRVATMARALRLDLTTDPDSPTVLVDEVDVTSQIRATRISEQVSLVAVNLEVRAELVARQQAIIASGGFVVEGRDTTTVVAPGADLRVLLTADEDARLKRRAREVHGSDDPSAVAATRTQVTARDDRDATVVHFQTAAEGVLELDTSRLTFDEVVTTMLRLVAEAVEKAADE